jgi:hypothetical protein
LQTLSIWGGFFFALVETLHIYRLFPARYGQVTSKPEPFAGIIFVPWDLLDDLPAPWIQRRLIRPIHKRLSPSYGHCFPVWATETRILSQEVQRRGSDPEPFALSDWADYTRVLDFLSVPEPKPTRIKGARLPWYARMLLAWRRMMATSGFWSVRREIR